MPDHYKQNHITKASKANRTADSHPVQVPKVGFNAKEGGVSAGSRAVGGNASVPTKPSMHKTYTQFNKGNKAGSHANEPKRDSRSGVYNTKPLAQVNKGAGQGMSAAYTKPHKMKQTTSKKTL